MNSIVWILLWSSTNVALTTSGNSFMMVEDNFSIRDSSAAIVAWKNLLQRKGKIFDNEYQIYEAQRRKALELSPDFPANKEPGGVPLDEFESSTEEKSK